VIDGRRAPVFDGISSEMVEIDEAVGINKWVRDFFARYEDDTSRIQVLAPSKRGPAGTVELNNAIQAIVNPGLGGLRRNNGLIRLGDRVMQSSNYRYTNAEGEMILLANGEVGNVTELDDAHIVIDMDSGEQHDLPLSASGGLQLSYSITVHKAQGSEFPIVIVPIHGSHYLQLQRRLVYTALSRAKERVIVVGTRRALALAISKDKQLRRQTMLPALLAGAETQPPPEPATDYIDQLVDEFNDVDF
jgi:exodeoxyribonuclease V alpha subunit